MRPESPLNIVGGSFNADLAANWPICFLSSGENQRWREGGCPQAYLCAFGEAAYLRTTSINGLFWPIVELALHPESERRCAIVYFQ